MAVVGEQGYFVSAEVDEGQDVISGMEFAIDMAEFRSRHVGQGVLDLEGVMA